MYQNIDKKLKEFYNEYKETPFQWGISDCSHFAAHWVKMFTGKDIASDMPEYSTENEAMAVLARLGYASQEDSLDNYFIRVDKRQLMRGDLVGHYFHGADYMAVGVHAGGSSFFKNAEGIQLVPYSSINKSLCWRVA